MTEKLKYVLAVALAMLLMLLVRTLGVSIHDVTGNGLAPLFSDGDRLLVNRCSYGVRIAGNGLLPYSRLWRQPVQRGDIVLFDAAASPAAMRRSLPLPSGLCVARCKGIPGDTILTNKGLLTIPGRATCADADYYWMEAVNDRNPIDSRHLGFVHERQVIGRVVTALYNRSDIPLP